jgi:hypothetical protein
VVEATPDDGGTESGAFDYDDFSGLEGVDLVRSANVEGGLATVMRSTSGPSRKPTCEGRYLTHPRRRRVRGTWLSGPEDPSTITIECCTDGALDVTLEQNIPEILYQGPATTTGSGQVHGGQIVVLFDPWSCPEPGYSTGHPFSSAYRLAPDGSILSVANGERLFQLG